MVEHKKVKKSISTIISNRSISQFLFVKKVTKGGIYWVIAVESVTQIMLFFIYIYIIYIDVMYIYITLFI